MEKRLFGMINRKGLSDVVTTVLIILIVFAAVFIIWIAVSRLMYKENVDSHILTATIDTNGNSVICNDSIKTVYMLIEKKVGNENVSAVDVVLYDLNGDSCRIRVNKTLKELETVKLEVNYSNCTTDKFSKIDVYPVVIDFRQNQRIAALSARFLVSWNSNGSCSVTPPPGECSPGETRTQACGVGECAGSRSITCGSDRNWGVWGICIGGATPVVEVCTGGKDEDCDGFIDCFDSNCTSDPNCAGVPSSILAPTNLNATAVSTSQINLTWQDNSANEQGFMIEGSSNGVSGWSNFANVSVGVTAYVHTGLSPNTLYYYRVGAFNSSIGINYSNVDSDITLALLFSLSVNQPLMGQGRINSIPSGISCGDGTANDCFATYAAGTNVILISQPSADAFQKSWSGCDSIEIYNCSVTMDRNRQVGASYELFDLTVGCSDNERNGFDNKALYPKIAACSGGWNVPSVFSDAACGRHSGDNSINSVGVGCSIKDLCSPTWHVCNSSADVTASSSTGCGGVETGAPNQYLFATQQSGTEYRNCRPDGANDIFGCGNIGVFPPNCAPLDRTFDSGQPYCNPYNNYSWSCYGTGADYEYNEAGIVTKYNYTYGGALCCKD